MHQEQGQDTMICLYNNSTLGYSSTYASDKTFDDSDDLSFTPSTEPHFTADATTDREAKVSKETGTTSLGNETIVDDIINADCKDSSEVNLKNCESLKLDEEEKSNSSDQAQNETECAKQEESVGSDLKAECDESSSEDLNDSFTVVNNLIDNLLGSITDESTSSKLNSCENEKNKSELRVKKKRKRKKCEAVVVGFGALKNWKRLIVHDKSSKKWEVTFVTPCGTRLKSRQSLDEFVAQNHLALQSDWFNFVACDAVVDEERHGRHKSTCRELARQRISLKHDDSPVNIFDKKRKRSKGRKTGDKRCNLKKLPCAPDSISISNETDISDKVVNLNCNELSLGVEEENLEDVITNSIINYENKPVFNVEIESKEELLANVKIESNDKIVAPIEIKSDEEPISNGKTEIKDERISNGEIVQESQPIIDVNIKDEDAPITNISVKNEDSSAKHSIKDSEENEENDSSSNLCEESAASQVDPVNEDINYFEFKELNDRITSSPIKLETNHSEKIHSSQLQNKSFEVNGRNVSKKCKKKFLSRKRKLNNSMPKRPLSAIDRNPSCKDISADSSSDSDIEVVVLTLPSLKPSFKSANLTQSKISDYFHTKNNSSDNKIKIAQSSEKKGSLKGTRRRRRLSEDNLSISPSKKRRRFTVEGWDVPSLEKSSLSDACSSTLKGENESNLGNAHSNDIFADVDDLTTTSDNQCKSEAEVNNFDYISKCHHSCKVVLHDTFVPSKLCDYTCPGCDKIITNDDHVSVNVVKSTICIQCTHCEWYVLRRVGFSYSS